MDVSMYMDDVHCKGKRIFRKKDKFRLLLCKSVSAGNDYGFTIHAVSCPTCGRTAVDLIGIAAEVERRLQAVHKPITVAVMGCIVNGPGEMADADYGYVGSSPEHITLYRGREIVERNIHQSEAIDHLIEIIKRDGRWHDPE